MFKKRRGGRVERFRKFNASLFMGSLVQFGSAARLALLAAAVATSIVGVTLGAISLSRLNALPPNKDQVIFIFKPEDILFVSHIWPPGHDPESYFFSIHDALFRAVELLPEADNLINIQISPGIYVEDLNLVSNVVLQGLTYSRGVQIIGTLTWTPGAGINLSQLGGTETVTPEDMTIIGDIVIDGSDRDQSFENSSALFTLVRCVILGNITATLGFNLDIITFSATSMTHTNHQVLVTGPGELVISGDSDAQANIECLNASLICSHSKMSNIDVFGSDSQLAALSCSMAEVLTDAGVVDLTACTTDVLIYTGSGTVRIFETRLAAGVSISNGTTAVIKNSAIIGTLSVDFTGNVDIRYSQFTNIQGPGSIDRSFNPVISMVTVNGTNTVPVDPRYTSPAYTILFTQKSGDPQSVVVTAQSTSSFSFTSPNNGISYDIELVLP